MNTDPIRLAALDLDGTLLDRTSKITPRTLEAIVTAIRRGVVVLPATGRGLSALPRVVASIPGVRYALTSNGAAVWDLGPDPMAAVRSRYGEPGPEPVAQPVCLYRRTLPAETARAVYALLERYEGELNFFADGRTFKTPAGLAWTRARMARLLSTEAKQADDGRFTSCPTCTPTLRPTPARSKNSVCSSAQRSWPARCCPSWPQSPEWRPPRAPPTMSRPPPPA